MASKSKEARLDQRAYWEQKLSDRLSILGSRGVDSSRVNKDVAVRKIRARLRETQNRLNSIESLEKKIEGMARLKAEKMAAPKEDKVKKKKETADPAETSKRQQKKKQKSKS
jgi:hypothetical protein